MEVNNQDSLVMEHKVMHQNRGEVHYWIHRQENRPWIIWTHGLTANHTMFEKQTAYFKNQYSQLLWDVPLHGASRPYQQFTYEHCAQDLREILIREQINEAVLVGMSMGGYPCQMFADLFAEMTAGFVALDTTPFGASYYSRSDFMWLKVAAPIAGWFSEKILKNSMAGSVSKTDYSYKKMQDMLSGLSKKQIVEQMDIAYGEFARENREISIQCPVLLLLGDSDKTGKVKTYNKMWAHKMGYPLVLIPDAAHFSNGDNPTRVNQEIEQFLKQIYPEKVRENIE